MTLEPRFIVVYETADGNIRTEYIAANNAQEAADEVTSFEEDVEIREVAKVMKSWK